MRWHPRLVAGLLLMGAAAPANAGCHLTQYLELPVTMVGARPLVNARINGQEARFILDSGAFFSTLSPAAARTYGLKLQSLPMGFTLRGINGSTDASLTTVKAFTVGGATLPNLQFLVGGSDTGQVGLLGQNFLGLFDAEYDLGRGVVRIMKPTDCQVKELAYWPGNGSIAILPIEARSAQQPHIVATVVLNGVKLRAIFDTGAPTSVMSMNAARRAGLTPASPGVTEAGTVTGLGSRVLRTWRGRFSKIEIGGEIIPNPTIRFTDAEFGGNADMLIGVDFFLTHHLYVANAARRMLITYEGGPVFGITPSGARMASGEKLDLTDQAAAPTDAEGYARRGAALLSNRKPAEALADLDKAVALAPTNAHFLRERARARLANRQPLLAAADLDKAVALEPNDIDGRSMRAALKLGAHDPDGAVEDLKVLDRLLPPAANQRLQLAGMADAIAQPELALANYDQWLKSHPGDAARATALNGRCWALGQLGRNLEQALSDCNAALKLRPGVPAYLDSRGLVRLRQNNLPLALADYDAALRITPRNAWTLLMRSVVKARMGDKAGAEADRAAAIGIAPRVTEHAAALGLTR